jgi:hypothetical protein
MKRKNKTKKQKESEQPAPGTKQPQNLAEFFAESPLAKARLNLEKNFGLRQKNKPIVLLGQ